MSTPITQDALNRLHANIANLTAQYVSGLLMDIEFAHAVYTEAQLITMQDGADLSNLLDPNTGLRYPTAKPNDKLTGGQDV